MTAFSGVIPSLRLRHGFRAAGLRAIFLRRQKASIGQAGSFDRPGALGVPSGHLGYKISVFLPISKDLFARLYAWLLQQRNGHFFSKNRNDYLNTIGGSSFPQRPAHVLQQHHLMQRFRQAVVFQLSPPEVKIWPRFICAIVLIAGLESASLGQAQSGATRITFTNSIKEPVTDGPYGFGY